MSRLLRATACCAALALACTAARSERHVLAEGRPVALPLGTLSWSGLVVRAGEPSRPTIGAPRLDAAGTWEIALDPPDAEDLNRHGMTLELAPGLDARQGASYESVRIEGGDGPAELSASLVDADGRETPVMALGMGDRVYVEVLGARQGAMLKLTAHAPVELPPEDPAPGPPAPQYSTLPCGGGGPCAFVQVSAGGGHSLAVTPTGEVRAWGNNEHGQLGDGTATNRTTPVVVLDVSGTGPLAGISQVSAGGGHSLALTVRGEVRAWGANDAGQLGDGTVSSRLAPVVVLDASGTGSLTGIVEISAGCEHSLALTITGEALAWGRNASGQLGDGTTADRPMPTVVRDTSGAGNLAEISQISAGCRHSLALTTSGEVRAWGYNALGQLGDGTTTNRTSPVAVRDVSGTSRMTGIAQVSAGGWHSLALTTTGEVRAWGSNVWHEGACRGSGPLPGVVTVSCGDATPLTGIAQVSAGGTSSMALTTTGEVRAWGGNDFGQLGDGTTDDQPAPVIVLDSTGAGPLSGIVQITAGAAQALALTTTGEIRGWGFDFDGQLGDGTKGQQPAPTCVRPAAGGGGPDEFRQVAAGARHSLALTTTGEVRAWGLDDRGQLGSRVAALAPVVVLDVSGSGPLRGITQVAAGSYHSLALTATGEVRAWGANDHGQLGIGWGSGPQEDIPVVVSRWGGGPLTGIAQVAAGGWHSLALTTTGEIWAWGYNFHGELGDGTRTDQLSPVAVQDVTASRPLTGIAEVAAGEEHSLAMTTTGEVRAWGLNYDGELGDGTTTDRSRPVVVQDVTASGPLTGIAHVAAGQYHSLALTMTGEVRAWGANAFGQLGDGTTSGRLLPVSVSSVAATGPLTGIVRVAAGATHSLALTTTGELRAWGGGSRCQLGDGTCTDRSTPVPVLDSLQSGFLVGVADMAGGGVFQVSNPSYSHSLALTSTGGVVAWGDDYDDQLGDGHWDSALLPIDAICSVPEQPPTCSAGPPVSVPCGPIALAATASDPDGDALTYAWSSSCADAQFSPSADVLDVSASFASHCGVSCDVTLSVSDGRGGTCSSTTRVTVDDVTPPVIACPGEAVLLCTDAVPAPDVALVSTSDNCASVTVEHVSDVATGTCPKRTARTYRATDECGNAAECVQYFTQFDHVPEADCTNGADDDGDTLVDCADDDCHWLPEPDCDGDGVPNGADCAPEDATLMTVPGEVPRLDVATSGADAALAWTDLAPSAGSATVHDVATGLLSELRADRGFARATCLIRDVPRGAATDVRALAAPGDGYWYLVRGENACGTGAWGPAGVGPVLCQ